MTPQPTITSLLLLDAMVCTTHATALDGKAINFADGDSITLLGANKIQPRIRSDGIDAREGATVRAAIERTFIGVCLRKTGCSRVQQDIPVWTEGQQNSGQRC